MRAMHASSQFKTMRACFRDTKQQRQHHQLGKEWVNRWQIRAQGVDIFVLIKFTRTCEQWAEWLVGWMDGEADWERNVVGREKVGWLVG